jgi:hypothetical protein
MVAHVWQKIDAGCHFCHSWQKSDERKITAMALLTIILAVAGLTALSWAVLYAAQLVKHDGYGRQRGSRTPPLSHQPDVFDPRYFHSGRHA